MLERPVIGVLARMQLAAWQDLARGWVAYEDWPHLRCVSCHQQIRRLADDTGTPYAYTDEQHLAAVVAHLRQRHMDLDPDR
jgi:hypothetical protein